MAGMMIHQEGSTHDWIPGLGYTVDLIITMDDATSEIMRWSPFAGGANLIKDR